MKYVFTMHLIKEEWALVASCYRNLDTDESHGLGESSSQLYPQVQNTYMTFKDSLREKSLSDLPESRLQHRQKHTSHTDMVSWLNESGVLSAGEDGQAARDVSYWYLVTLQRFKFMVTTGAIALHYYTYLGR